MEKEYLIKLIEGMKLDENEIKSLILYDTKKEVMIKEKYDELFGRIKNLNILNNFKEKLYYNEQDSYLKNILKYATINSHKLTFDCDISNFASMIIQKIYGVKQYGISGRYYNMEKYIFESDTMNSFNTIFLYYIRTILKEKNKELAEEYKKTYNCENSRFYRSLYILENIDNIKQKVVEKDNIHEQIFNQLEILARITHSIGNFALVPFRFNCYRGISNIYHDYWNKSYLDSLTNEKLALKICKIPKEIDIVFESINAYRNLLNKEFDKPINIDERINFDNKKIGNIDESTYENILNILVYMNYSILSRAIKICNKLSGLHINEFETKFFKVENVQEYIKQIDEFIKSVKK